MLAKPPSVHKSLSNIWLVKASLRSVTDVYVSRLPSILRRVELVIIHSDLLVQGQLSKSTCVNLASVLPKVCPKHEFRLVCHFPPRLIGRSPWRQTSLPLLPCTSSHPPHPSPSPLLLCSDRAAPFCHEEEGTSKSSIPKDNGPRRRTFPLFSLRSRSRSRTLLSRIFLVEIVGRNYGGSKRWEEIID